MRVKRLIRAAQRSKAHVAALGLVSVLLASCASQAVQPTPMVIVITVVTIATPEPTMTPTATLAVGPTTVVDGTTTATAGAPVSTATATDAPRSPSTAIPTRRPPPTRTPQVATAIPAWSPTPFIPTVTAVPPPVITEWRGEYFNNIGLIGDPTVVRNDGDINFDWLTGAPDPRINVDLWSARWTRSLLFEGGTYRFALNVDDGVRLFIDGVLVLDDWRDGAREIGTDVTLGRGNHNVRVEYYERGGRASIRLRITQAPAATLTPFPTWTRVPATPTFVPSLTPIPIASATTIATALPTQPVPPPSQTPTIIPDITSTSIPPSRTPIPPTPTPTHTAIPTSTPRPTEVPATATAIPATATATDVPTVIPEATETPEPSATATETSTPLPDDTATPEASITPTETPLPKRPSPTPTPTAANVITPTVVAILDQGELTVTGTRWQTRVNIGVSADADGSGATALGTAPVNRRGAFSFSAPLNEATSPNPLYVVVQDRRSRVVVRVVRAAEATAETPPVDSAAATPMP